MIPYKEIRFFLFYSSYPGKTIASYLNKKFNGKKLLKAVKKLSLIMGFNNKQLEELIFFEKMPRFPYQRVPFRLKVYLEIEKELINLVGEKLDEYLTAKEDYQNQLLSPAIERAVGNSLIKVENDNDFEKILPELVKKYTYIYYKVAYKYKLPTIRIVPFLIRLISD